MSSIGKAYRLAITFSGVTEESALKKFDGMPEYEKIKNLEKGKNRLINRITHNFYIDCVNPTFYMQEAAGIFAMFREIQRQGFDTSMCLEDSYNAELSEEEQKRAVSVVEAAFKELTKEKQYNITMSKKYEIIFSGEISEEQMMKILEIIK